MKFQIHSILALGAVLGVGREAAAQIIVPPTEDVMTSSFFTGTDLVRGYVGDNRATFRVSTHEAFDLPGAETIYLKFDPSAFSSLTGPVPQALLTMTSVTGGFGGDAGPSAPFTVSAHAMNADPFTSITDNTNASGPISWINFYANNILAAAPAASTVINGFGQFQFDVTSIVNGWLAGSNTVYSIALTGKNDLSGTDFLHGFSNNSNTSANQGVTFLTVIPEPAGVAMLSLCGLTLIGRRKQSITA